MKVRTICMAMSAAAALCAACASSRGVPGAQAPVVLTARIDRAEITAGGTAVASFRLENTTGSAITLDFSNGCQIQPFIAKRPSNDVIYPDGGSWVCTQALTSLTLPPNGATVKELSVVAGDKTPTHVGLPAGEYSFFARVESSQYKLESGRVTLTVKP